MNAFEHQRLFSALLLLVTALFVGSGVVSGEKWRKRLRLAAIICFIIAVTAAVIDVALWAMGPH
jgi:Sec-independent protein secretion pathway component TatC